MNNLISKINNTNKRSLKDLTNDIKYLLPINNDLDILLQNKNKILLNNDIYKINLKRWYLGEEFKNVYHKSTILCILGGKFFYRKPFSYNHMIMKSFIINSTLYENDVSYLEDTIQDLQCISDKGYTLHITE
jgi:hypothetical protein